MSSEPPVYIGVNLPAKQGVSNQRVVDAALAQGYDLITARITSRAYRKRVQTLYDDNPDEDLEVPPPQGEDLVVLPGPHVLNTIALCAPWAELDSKDARLAEISYKVLVHEIGYAKFCGLPYVVIEGPKRRTNLARYAHSLGKLLRKFPSLKIIIHTTFTEEFRENQPPHELLSTWEVWDGVRTLCGHPKGLGLALEVQHTRTPEHVMERWACEPIQMLIFSEARAFVPNPKSYPVLPKHTQHLLQRLISLHPFLLIKENLGPHKAVEFNGGDDACLIYLRNFTTSPRTSRVSVVSTGSHQSKASRLVDAEVDVDSLTSQIPEKVDENYADVLEVPLQPLDEPLDSSVYEVFETDIVKYSQYYRAVVSAISNLPLTPEPLYIAVLGAGRGALVDKVLDAVASTRLAASRAVSIFAVEKHTGPTAYLHARKASEPVWSNVHVVQSDMRDWQPPAPINIVVSELLGSFGDNELSPECLLPIEQSPDWLAHNAVMIPASYTAFVSPLFSPRLWSEARAQESDGLERPYVVCMQQVERLDTPQPAWSFQHPSRVPHSSSTRRQAKLSFMMKAKSRVYGFAGYFEATLYPGIGLSTNPVTKDDISPGLASWFPMFFPIKEPIDVGGESIVDISLWRERENHKVWYEWAIESYDRGSRRSRTATSTIHNAEGGAQSLHL